VDWWASEELAMTTPTVTELPRTLEATTTDPFIDGASSRLVSTSQINAPRPRRSHLSDHAFDPHQCMARMGESGSDDPEEWRPKDCVAMGY
jgi:hypothetical protein